MHVDMLSVGRGKALGIESGMIEKRASRIVSKQNGKRLGDRNESIDEIFW